MHAIILDIGLLPEGMKMLVIYNSLVLKKGAGSHIGFHEIEKQVGYIFTPCKQSAQHLNSISAIMLRIQITPKAAFWEN